MKHFILFTCIALLLLVNQIFLYLYPAIGIFFSVYIIGLFLFFTMYDIYDFKAEETLTYAAVIPALSLVQLSLQISNQYYNLLFLYVFLLIVSECYYSFLPKNYHIYHTKNLVLLPLFIILGVVTACGFSYFLPHYTLNTTIILPLSIIILSSIAEAVFFQGLIQNAAAAMTDTPLAVIFTIILFGFTHATGNITSLSILIMYAVANSVIYAKWKNIYLVMAFSYFTALTLLLLGHGLFIAEL